MSKHVTCITVPTQMSHLHVHVVCGNCEVTLKVILRSRECLLCLLVEYNYACVMVDGQVVEIREVVRC